MKIFFQSPFRSDRPPSMVLLVTITMMGTPGNLYYANQGAVHGAINASSGAAAILTALNDPQVAVHGPILTGAVGLPIAQMQIKPSFTPVGTIPIMTSGDQVQGYPQISVNYESVYTFDHGALRGFRAGGAFQIEPDASSGSYFWAVNALWPDLAAVKVRNWPTSGWQIDADFPVLMPHAGEPASATTSRKTDLGDAIMTAIVIAPLATSPAAFTHLGVLRRQECERVAALKHELHRCGAQVQERGDTLEISPSRLHGAIINTYHDHRMAMCFATLGLKVPGMRLYDPSCVKKTFPDFFQKLAAPAPDGLGAEIWECSTVDGKRVRRLTDLPDLFAA